MSLYCRMGTSFTAKLHVFLMEGHYPKELTACRTRLHLVASDLRFHAGEVRRNGFKELPGTSFESLI
jgi:hypothetical protein